MSIYKTNNKAWERIFEDYDILNKINEYGFFKITAKQINEYREARLMTKFDNRESVPEILKNNKLSILPTSGNSYMIARFSAYKKIDKAPKEIQEVNSLPFLQSLDSSRIISESLALNYAYCSNMLADFLEEVELYPTVSGKMGSGNFEFNISQINNEKKLIVNVENSRIEIDGAYEGYSSLALIEVKNVVSNDFLIRQLYYPYRLWKKKVSKKVRPIFLIYSNDIFTFYEYKFDDENDYSSIKLVKSKRYSIVETKIDLNTIKEITLSIKKFKSEPQMTFPQADNFDRIINLCELIYDSEIEKEYISEYYDFVERQTYYYVDAAIYLGLIYKAEDNKFYLTKNGERIIKLKYKERHFEFIRLILSHEIFNLTLRYYFDTNKIPARSQIVNWMNEKNINVGKSLVTQSRRATTIRSWIKWILNLINN